MYEQIDSLVSVDNIEKYRQRIIEWLPKYENKISPTGQTYLISAEYLSDTLAQDVDIDFAPAIIQYCRVFEHEMKLLIFENFADSIGGQEVLETLIQESIDILKEAAQCDYSFTNTKCKQNLYKPLKEPWSRSLEAIRRFIITINDDALNVLIEPTTPLFKKYNTYLSTIDKSKLYEPDFLMDYDKIKNDFRNPTAHGSYPMTQTDLENCKVSIKRFLNRFCDLAV